MFGVHAQTSNNIQLNNYTVADGLVHNWVFDVVQDQSGYIWLATENGLTRYDGHEFTTFKHNPNDKNSLSHNVVWTLAIDSANRLWVGTWQGGINLYDPVKERFTRYSLQNNTFSKNVNQGLNSIRSIAQDAKGQLWLGTASGLVRLDSKTKEVEHFFADKESVNSLGHRWIRVVKFDDLNRLWIGTEGGGISIFDINNSQFRHIRATRANPTGLSNNFINDILFDSQNNLWIGTENGLNLLENWQEVYDGQSNTNKLQFRHFYSHQDNDSASNSGSLHHNEITSIFEDSKAQVWASTPNGVNQLISDGKISVFKSKSPLNGALTGRYVYNINEDKQRNLWIASDDGVTRVLKRAKPFNPVTSIASSSNGIFLGETSVDTPVKLADFELTTGIYQQQNGNFWLATKQGLIKKSFDGKVHVFKHNESQNNSLSHSHIHSVGEDNRGNLWVASHRGLNLYRAGSNDFERFYHQPDKPNSISHIDINAVFKDSLGDMWFGTGAGVNRLTASGLQNSEGFSCYLCDQTIDDDIITVLSITETENNHILLGTWESGLVYLNPNDGSYQRYRNNVNGESLTEIWGLYQQSLSQIWLATSNGLQYFDVKRKTITPANLPKAIQQASYEVLADDNQRLWFSTKTSIVRFNPITNHYWEYKYSNYSDAKSSSPRHGYKGKDGMLYFTGEGNYIRFNPNEISDDTSKPNVILTHLLVANERVEIAENKTKSSGKMHLSQSVNHVDTLTINHVQNHFGFEFAALNVTYTDKVNYAYQLKGLDDDWIYTDHTDRKVTYNNIPTGVYTFTVKASNNDGIWNEQGKSLNIIVLPPPWLSWWAITLYVFVVTSFMLLFYTNHSQKTKLKYQQQVNHQLQHLDKLKDQFLANTSHELRTPLNGIIGLAESLLEGERGQLPLESKHDLSLVVSSGKRLSNLINDILDFSKLKDHQLKLDISAVDLKIMVDMVFTLSTPLIGDKSIELSNEIPDDFVSVAADENRLQQILHNLIGNGIKFTELGSVTVSVKINKQQDWVTIDVTDTGIGISEDKFERIFLSFEQADGSETRQYGGTGLGLCVTRQLVELHGGRISVESKTGQNTGSCFSFTLPVAGAEVKALQHASKVASIHNIEAVGEGGAYAQPLAQPIDRKLNGDFKILMVDDEPINLQVLNNHLANQPYQLVKAANGEQALEMIAQGQVFDLVLLDIMMPKLTGYQVCQAIRKQHPINDLPVIFLTAKNQVTDLVKSYQAGGNDYLAKPVAKHELLSRIETQLRLLDINRNLEQQVKQRTNDLLLSDKMASLGTLTAGVAHEINNPNNFIHVSMQNMEEDLVEFKNFLLALAGDNADAAITKAFDSHFGRLKRHVYISKDGTERIKSIVDDLRTFTQLDRAEQNQVVVTDLIKATVTLVQAKYSRIVDFNLDFPIDSQQLQLECYPAQINQVLMNVIVNACEAIECCQSRQAQLKGCVHITCIKHDNAIEISIKDNGRGMDETTQNQLFDPFFTTKPVGFGTGLGMSISFGIIERHGGDIKVNSALGKGCEIVLILPL